MQKIIYTFIFLFTIGNIIAQRSPYVVEVAAFAQHAPNGHFGDLEGIYETLDANYIYRYYIDADSPEEAEEKKAVAQKAGFVNAKIVDFEALQENCSAVCKYVAPKKTGKEVVPFSSLTSEFIDIQHLHCIFFDFDKSFIREDASQELNKLVTVLKQNTGYSVNILAHTDARGSDEYNNALSMRRALATQHYLTKKGIRKSKISKKTYGETHPIALNELDNGDDTEMGRQYNRRVEFRILNKAGEVMNIVDKIRIPNAVQPH